MFFNDISKDLLLKGALHAEKTPSEKSIARCERINWFLYRADYLLGRRRWQDASPDVKRDVLDGLVHYVMTSEKDGVFCSLSVLPYSRRARLMR